MNKNEIKFYKDMYKQCSTIEQRIAFQNFFAIIKYFHLEKDFMIDKKDDRRGIHCALLNGFFNEFILWRLSAQGAKVWYKCHLLQTILNYCTLLSIDEQLAKNILKNFISAFWNAEYDCKLDDKKVFQKKIIDLANTNFHNQHPIAIIEKFIQPYIDIYNAQL